MDTGLLHLHSLLRWVILLLLLVSLYYSFVKNERVKSIGLWLMIASHVMILIGLYQFIFGRFGWVHLPEGLPLPKNIIIYDDGALQEKPIRTFLGVINHDFYRFYLLEHPICMIMSVVMITLARRKAKDLNYRSVKILLLVSLVLILYAIPWPFREDIARPLFPGM